MLGRDEVFEGVESVGEAPSLGDNKKDSDGPTLVA